jgi:hypothetical protein
VLIVPDEGDPVAVFELDSRYHDLPENAGRDAMKNSLIAATGLPFFRLSGTPCSLTMCYRTLTSAAESAAGRRLTA